MPHKSMPNNLGIRRSCPRAEATDVDSFGNEQQSVVQRQDLNLDPSGSAVVCLAASAARRINIYGEFDPGSGRTLAACFIHASRTVKRELALVDQWRTGE